MHILQQKAASLAEIVSALLSSPLSPAQRRLVASFQNLVEDWTTEQLSTLGSNQLSLMAPNFQAEEFCLAELVRDASQALQQVAAARGIESRVALSEPSPAKVVGDPSHLSHLMTLLSESCLALSQARRLALQASVDPAKPGPAGLRIELLIGVEGSAGEIAERFSAIAGAASTLRAARFPEAELSLAVCWHLVQALGGTFQCGAPTADEVRLGLLLPVGVPLPAGEAVPESATPPEGVNSAEPKGQV